MDSIPSLPGSSPDEMFPVLTVEQQARVLAHGRTQRVASGETLVELNQQPTKIFVVVEGRLELFQISDNNLYIAEDLATTPTTGRGDDIGLQSLRRAITTCA